MTGTSRPGGGGVARVSLSVVIATTLFLGACLGGGTSASQPDQPDRAPGNQGVEQRPEDTSSTSATSLTVSEELPLYAWPDDVSPSVEFWQGLHITGFEYPYFGEVEPLADWATLVVVGVPVGIGPSIILSGDPDNNETSPSFTVEIEVKEVVRSRATLYGIAEPIVGDRILVVVHRRPPAAVVETPALFFLESPEDPRYIWHRDLSDVPIEYREILWENIRRWNEFLVGKYELVNSQGVLVGDSRSTVNPNNHGGADLLTEAIEWKPISEIVELIRSMAPPEP